jgi:GT2 family glycosyltransferase
VADEHRILSAPEISVVVPTLDRWSLVSRAVAGVLAQEDVALELIVVDDGSSDGTAERLADLRDPRLRVVRHERSLGVARARNDGLAVAAGRWTAFLDDDDAWAPRKLREQIDAAEDVGAALAYSSAVVLDDDRRPAGLDPAPPAEGLAQDLLRHNSMPGGCSNVIAPTALLRELGGFDKHLSLFADWDLWLRLARSGAAARCAQPHVAYLDHGASMHVRRADLAPAELAYLAEKHPALVEQERVTPGSGAWFMLWTAAGQYRAGHRGRAIATYVRTAIRYRSPGALVRAGAAPFTDHYVRRDAIESSLQPLATVPDWLDAVPHRRARRAGTSATG